MSTNEVYHINATAEDLEGNKGQGRFILMPGSDERAKIIAQNLSDVRIKKSDRRHHFYLGHLKNGNDKIDIGVISSGMGAPSIDIIVNELYILGCKFIVRVGTCGSLSPNNVKVGDLVIPTASVKDESTSNCYIPRSVPALPSFNLLNTINSLHAKYSKENDLNIHFGINHTKDSLYGREFLKGPKKDENQRYMELLKKSGVISSDMESSLLFTLGQVYSTPENSTLNVASILAVVGDNDPFSTNVHKQMSAVDDAIQFSFELIKKQNTLN